MIYYLDLDLVIHYSYSPRRSLIPFREAGLAMHEHKRAPPLSTSNSQATCLLHRASCHTLAFGLLTSTFVSDLGLLGVRCLKKNDFSILPSNFDPNVRFSVPKRVQCRALLRATYPRSNSKGCWLRKEASILLFFYMVQWACLFTCQRLARR